MKSNNSPRVYISYSNNDKELVVRMAKDLSENGIELWYDDNLIKDGGIWQEALMKGITEADCVLVLITENSISSKYVMNELGMARAFAMKESKLLLPIIYGDVMIPDFIKDIQVIFWRDNYGEVIERIVKAVYNSEDETMASEADIEDIPKSSEKKRAKPGLKKFTLTSKIVRNYWLFKMNPGTWKIDDLKVDEKTFFSTHYFEAPRPEYDLLKKVNTGDYVLGYASGRYQRIVCEMEVTSPIGPNNAQGESFEMIVKKLVSNTISLESFRNIIPDIAISLERVKTPPELFFSISETAYNEILLSEGEREKGDRKIFQPYYVTEGDHENTVDQLEFKNDIESFASVIALKKVTPPLAIGLFGNWGSGKSFFMEKLQVRIDEICGKEPGYVSNVVQVKFNSWHYSDTNLWASLITEIFDSLNRYAKDKSQEPEIDKLTRTLKTTSLEREVMDEKRKALEIAVKELQEEQAQKRKRLEDISGIGLLKFILRDKRINKDLSELNNENIESVISDSQKVDQYIDEIQDTGNKAFFFFREFFNFRGWRWLLVIAIAIIVAVGVPLLKNIFPSFWENITWQVRIYAGLISAFTANIIAAVRPYKKMINDALNRLQSVKKTFESRAQVEDPQLTSKEKELSALKSSLVNIDNTIKNTQEDIDEILSGKRLQKFIDDRTRDENYNNALGVISRIRKDFVTLDTLLREQHILGEKEKNELFNPEKVTLQIDRVILYIDDLDRCNEEVVVKVLEAIHLLLAFKLFVVIVGVDPRWLNNALSEKYKNLFGKNGHTDNIHDDKQKDDKQKDDKEEPLLNAITGTATSYDYLEKIFQIPFALKPINKPGRENLIKYLIREEMAPEKKQGTEVPGEQTPQVTVPSDTGSIPTPKSPDEGVNAEAGKTTGTAGIAAQTEKRPARERLVFTKEELEYMQEISSLFGHTPRTINRYVNIYRIIKAHGSLNTVGEFSGDDFMPVMLILGIIVGHADFAEEFIDQVKAAGSSDTFGDFMANCVLPERIKKIITALSVDIKNLSMSSVRRNIDLISRFSFRTLLKQD